MHFSSCSACNFWIVLTIFYRIFVKFYQISLQILGLSTRFCPYWSVRVRNSRKHLDLLMCIPCFEAESPLKSKDCGNNRPSNIISMMDGQGWFWHQPVVSTKTNSLWVTPLPHTRLNCPNYFRNQKKWVDNWGYFSVC